MKGKTGKILLFSIMVVSLILGCEDVWHPPEYNPGSSGPFMPDGKSYTVSFDANGGSGTSPGSKSAKSGESITIPNSGSLSRTGYSFDCWNTSASGSGTNYPTGMSFTVPVQNVTLYAKWLQVSSGGNTGGSGPSTVSVSGVSLNKSSLALNGGYLDTLTATVSPSNATNKNVSWTTSKSDVATVSDGTVTAKSAGTATITVTTADGGKTATCAVTVTAAATVPVSGVSLNKTSLSLAVGESETLTATVSPSDATNKTVSWTTSNPSLATVSGGTVTGISIGGTGMVTITVITADGNKKATCDVKVVPSGPTNVSATATSSSSITVSWSPVPYATSYVIYYGLTSAANSNLVDSNSTSYTFTGLKAGTTYYFAVGSVYNGSWGGTSGVVSATTQP